MVALGTFKRGLPAELMTKYLSINDIASTNIDDSTTVYTAGKFNSLLDAENRKKQLAAEGMKDAKVVYKQNGKFYDAPNYSATTSTSTDTKTNNPNVTNNDSNTNPNTANNNSTNNNTNSNNTNTNNTNTNTTNNSTTNSTNTAVNNQGIVLRVQLGAYKNRLSKGVFKDVPNLIEIKTEDGLYKYMTGSYTTFDAAAKHKVDMVLKGYQGAFITAYKDGKRVSLEEAGATKMKKEDLQEIEDNATVNALNTKLIVFKVQVGVFKNEPPAEKQELYGKLKNLNKETTASGLNRYVVGSFSDYKQAMEAKNEAIKAGATDAFIIALYNGEYIPIQEALELIK
jgi:cell division protein FtsN